METHNHLADGVDRGYGPPGESAPLQQIADRATGACVMLLRYLETTDAPNTGRRR